MELRPGYKHTEIGILPEDWEIKPVSELGEVTTGGTPSTIRSEFWNGCFPWVTPSDIGEHRDIVETERMITDAGLRAIRSLPKDSVLVTCIASIGKNAILRRAGGCNQQINAVIPNEKNNPEFLYYTFNFAKQYLLANSGITATRIISKSAFERLGFAVPPTTEEQYAIAEALSDADALIESMESLIAKKRAIKQGAMQELLSGRRRLPGFSGEWAKLTLGDLYSFKNGLNKAKRFFGTGTPIINFMDVLTLPHIRECCVKGQVTLSTAERDNFSAKKGDVFFTRTSETVEEVGMASVLVDEIPDAVFSGFVLRARPTCDVLDSTFTGYALRTESVRRQIVATASYTTRALTNGRFLSAVLLAVPPRNEQRAIGQTISEMDDELAALEEKLSKGRQIKQGMMQELLTGRVRLL